ncbi:hypothetical protein F4814DRAFT_347684 [Daldinia grandis]|nr:hypothetical protein F4814DRAFT_347684 [Daldinia grandis]
MPPLPPGSGFDLFCHIILVVYLAVFIFLNANHIRNLVLAMADMMDPQTPPRKLFKPSSKTKTPTPSKKQRPTTSTHSSVQSREVLTPIETDNLSGEKDSLDQSIRTVKNIGGKAQENLSSLSNDLPESSNPTDALNSPTEVARYFAERGNSGMSTFVSALADRTQHDQTDVASNGVGTPRADTKDHGDKLVNAGSESIKQLPNDDALVVSPNERTKEMLEKLASDTTNKVPNFASLVKEESKDDDIVNKHAPKGPDVERLSQDNNIIDEIPNRHRPTGVSKEAEGVTGGPEGLRSDAAPTNIIGEPNTGILSEEAHIGVSGGEPGPDISVHGTAGSIEQDSAPGTSGVLGDDMRVADNMGQPAHIERRIEIPLPRPEKIETSPSEPANPKKNNISVGLGDPDELPDVQDLPGIDDLQDPPEEVLDPSVHSPSPIVTPIPKIPKITPIGMAPPPDLPRLAHGLGGGVVDDVGSIVDASGKVLGHATGDLPAMVGRKVADNGEVYGESGEVIGYVSENFTSPPPPVDIPENVLGGLKIDHDGNILDTNGNIIGRFNEKAEENENLAPFMKRSKPDESRTEDGKADEKKPKVNAHTGGSPSDIFLDVKSTTDGIQLTIRIPTTFGRQPQDT